MANPIPKKYAGVAPQDFALGAGKYPINTIKRARSALARISANGTPSQQQQVRKKVKAKYPSIQVSGLSKASSAALSKTKS